MSGLRYWSSRIRREAGDALNEALEGPRFAKVRTTKAAAPRARSSSPSPLLVHVGEVRVEVPADFDAQTLRRVVEALRATGGGR